MDDRFERTSAATSARQKEEGQPERHGQETE
jgi:hypothetical protein